MNTNSNKNHLFLSGVFVVLAGATNYAQAVPSFARQTGMACEGCHTTYPELNGFGRDFKINGYTMTGIPQIESKGGAANPELKINQIPPLSLMLQTNISDIKKATQDLNAEKGVGVQRSEVELPQQISLFFAGEIAPKMGSFIQLTYDHQSDHFSIDNTDIRYADHFTQGGTDITYGFTVNNNPSVEDPWQGTPVWGFPFISPGLLPGPTAGALIDGKLAQDAAGFGGYVRIDRHWYADLTLYRSEHGGASKPYDSNATNTLKSAAPYWRIAYETNLASNQYLEVGAYGIFADIIPSGVQGESNNFRDSAVDAQYETKFGANSLVVRATYIHEKADRNASFDAGEVLNKTESLNTWRINSSFRFDRNKSVSLGYSVMSGSEDAALYNPAWSGPLCGANANTCAVGTPAPNTGSRTGKPDTKSWIAQYTYYPYQNVQIGAQYTVYTLFNGASSNYDGFDRNASDNNTAMLFGWFVW